MSKPQKRVGFRQGIYDVSITQKEAIGLVRKTDDGRTFVYAKAGASALAAGKMSQAAAAAAAVINKAAIIAAVGVRQLLLTIASATYAENYFAGGQLVINAGPGAGNIYKIESSQGISSGTTILINLEEPIRVAITASSYFTLTASPFMATVESATQTSTPTGVTPVAVPAGCYYWSQIGGITACLCGGAIAVGANVTLGSAAGSVSALSATIGTTILQPIIGFCTGAPGVDTEYRPIFLAIAI
jgi:hypothetical protein